MKPKTPIVVVALLGAVCLLTTTGCSDDTSTPATDPFDEHGCDHLEFGPNHDVTAAGDPTGAPDVQFHSASHIALTANKPAYVAFDAAGAGEHAIFSDTAGLDIALYDDKGGALAPTTTATSSTKCTLIKAKAKFAVPAAGHYVVKLTLASAATIKLAVVPPLDQKHDGGNHGDGHHMQMDGHMSMDGAVEGGGG